jgi:tetratricopeptide (TPR) repeat protein
MFYLDQVEGRRRDVISIDVSLLRRSWYFDFLKRAYPDLVQGSQAEVDAFLQDLVDWEHDPALYQRDATLNQRINRRFYDMILSFVSTQLDRGAVYVTQDIAAGRNSQDAELTQSLATSYQLVPQGLVFEVVRDKEFHEPATPILQTRGLADGTLRFDKDDTVSVKVLPTYIEMLINRGRYLAAYGRHESAIEAYNQALVLDPDSRLARRYLAESQSALSNAPLPQKQ